MNDIIQTAIVNLIKNKFQEYNIILMLLYLHFNNSKKKIIFLCNKNYFHNNIS